MSEHEFVPLVFPPWTKWGQRRGIDLPQPEGRGANGRRFCRWCATEVPKRCTSWCSQRCSGFYLRVFTWEAVATYVRQRDRVCQRCGTKHPGWKPTQTSYYGGAHCDLKRWWEVDHIVPVVDGGTDDPANLRLLCHACHVAVGYEQRAARLPEPDQLSLSA